MVFKLGKFTALLSFLEQLGESFGSEELKPDPRARIRPLWLNEFEWINNFLLRFGYKRIVELNIPLDDFQDCMEIRSWTVIQVLVAPNDEDDLVMLKYMGMTAKQTIALEDLRDAYTLGVKYNTLKLKRQPGTTLE